MKQRKPLARGTGLIRRTALTATTSLSRSTRLASTGPVKARRPAALTALERTAKEIVIERAQGRCEIGVCCGRTEGIDFSHRWSEGQGGAYVPSNGLLSCRLDHQMLHANPVYAKANGWFIPPTWHTTADDTREPIAPADVPVFVWRADGWGPEWVWLDDFGGMKPISYDELDSVLAEHGLGRIA